ncbi:carboxymuconolactone decarboxylase family protein [Labilibaculum antarcticum]|uniref:Alkylhydroperoxidase n=1 Tax=Labilibaculum antarcticum TaxID=1717717 RepID=A0A1Y1CFT0_9BACT|nr:carboxymuconolactone decarboxylase family protein [Labilibaculum antarcticum]BAX79174.1 alkylhydroperoxidase [Labilibaculum antarcticum]
MRTITVPTIEQLDAKGQQILGQVKSQMGMVPNLYATIAYSSDTLETYLAYSSKAGKGSFSSKELEAIKLSVSEVNRCEYCLAAHTAIAKMNGFTEEETIQLRDGSITDIRLRALSNLAADVAQNRGNASDITKENFFEAGFDEKALIDFLAVVVEITFTNYAHNLTKVPVDFPKAKVLSQKAA